MISARTTCHAEQPSFFLGHDRSDVCVELGAGRGFDEVLLKQLTGGDRIRARRMREDFWEFEPTHKLWVAANHKPIVKGNMEYG